MPKNKNKRVSFIVSFDLPVGARIRDAQAYVWEAVASMKGALQPPCYGPGGYDPEEPGDPMFGLDADSVRVVRSRGPK